MDQPDYWNFWAKTAEDGGIHPLPCHLLDVAAVAEAWLDLRPERLARHATALSIEDHRALRALVLWLVALHDIGKASVAFQAQSPDHWPERLLGPFPDNPPRCHHGAVTAWYFSLGDGAASARIKVQGPGPLYASLRRYMPCGTGVSAHGAVVDAVAGHHGRPIDRAALSKIKGKEQGTVGPVASAAAVALADDLAALFEVMPVIARWDDTNAPVRFAWFLATLLPLADWVGSNILWFPPSQQPMPLADYWARARRQAATALAQAGLVPAGIAPPSAAAVLPKNVTQLSPVQDWAATAPLPSAGPTLAIVEDATGSGKTEAGLILAHRMLDAGLARGVHFALPTMATANAMFARLGRVYRGLFTGDPGEPVEASLALAHGRVTLDKTTDGDADDESAVAAYCAGWIENENRKAFFAQAGAGTIDQAILAVLPARYQTLRLCGLADTVLVVDEAHAYDAYVSEEVEGLLRFHAAQGGSAILLSATLPLNKRAKLVRAFAEGARWQENGEARTPHIQAFPLATLATADGLMETPLPMRADTARTVRVDRLPDVAVGEEAALAAARQGAAVALMRTTVDAAIASFERLTEAAAGDDSVEVLLFHARYLFDDRKAIEDRVLSLFGKDGTPAGRRGKLLVATGGIIGESLDLDFDSMITDLAPVDLVIQRAGRLWRHGDRDHRPMPGPILHIVSPEPPADPTHEWLDADLPEAVWVYRDPALLWRGAKALFAAGRIVTDTLQDRANADTPDHPRRLVEDVYGGDHETLPEGLREAADRRWGQEAAERSLARHTILRPDQPYAHGTTPWADEARVMTRLGDSVTVRVARDDGGRLRPLTGEDWRRSELRLGPRLATGLKLPSEDQLRRLAPAWERAAKGTLLLVLKPDENGGWVDEGGERSYMKDVGLVSPHMRG